MHKEIFFNLDNSEIGPVLLSLFFLVLLIDIKNTKRKIPKIPGNKILKHLCDK